MSFRSTFAEIRSVLEVLMTQDAIKRLGSRVCHDLELTLAEALNNVAEHAYDEAVPGLVSMAVTIGPGSVITEIRDYGRPFHQPEGSSEPRVVADAEGGRGLFLIRSLCQRVDHRRRGDENILTLELVSSD